MNSKSAGYIRTGKSIFPPTTVEDLKSLRLLEQLVPIFRINKLKNNKIVGVETGAGGSVKDAMQIAKEYSRALNSNVSKNPFGPLSSLGKTGGITGASDRFSLSNLVASLSKFLVIPVPGNKGNLNITEFDLPDMGDLDDLDYLRGAISIGAGIPKEYIFSGAEEGIGRLDLKVYVKYVNKLVAYQNTLKKGLKQLGYMHLKAQGKNPGVDDIEVVFTNLIDISQLDALEYLDTLIGLLGNFSDYIENVDRLLTEKFADTKNADMYKMNPEELLKFIYSNLSNFEGAQYIFKDAFSSIIKKENNTSSEKEVIS